MPTIASPRSVLPPNSTSCTVALASASNAASRVIVLSVRRGATAGTACDYFTGLFERMPFVALAILLDGDSEFSFVDPVR